MEAVLAFWALLIVGTVGVQATTRYIVEADRLLIRRAGFIWMEILFRDVEEIEQRTVVYSTIFSQIRMFRLGFGWRLLRITKSRGFRYVLINPRDPAPIIEAFGRFRALRTEQPDLPATPGPERRLPDWLQRH